MTEFQSFDFSQLPRIAGHRGAKGSAPENTLSSLRKAAEIGVSFIEFDVNLAANNVVVVFHDYTLERCTNGSGNLIDYDYALLSQLDAGSHFSSTFAGEKIPRFVDVISLLEALNMGANVEIKSQQGNEAATVDATVAALRQHWPRQLPLLLSSFNEDIMRLLTKKLPEVSRGWLVEEIPPDWQAKLNSFAASSFHCWDRTLQKHQVEEVSATGYPILVYTVNQRERAAELLRWGVSSVISDNPERMMDLNTA